MPLWAVGGVVPHHAHEYSLCAARRWAAPEIRDIQRTMREPLMNRVAPLHVHGVSAQNVSENWEGGCPPSPSTVSEFCSQKVSAHALCVRSWVGAEGRVYVRHSSWRQVCLQLDAAVYAFPRPPAPERCGSSGRPRTESDKWNGCIYHLLPKVPLV